MDFSVEHHKDLSIVIAKMHGVFDMDACLAVARQAREKARENDCSALYDMRMARLDMSMSDLYEWPHRIYREDRQPFK